MRQSSFDPSRYPRSYVPSAQWRAIGIVVSLFCAAMGLLVLWATITVPMPSKGVAGALALATVGLFLTAIGVTCFIISARARVILGPTFIECRRFLTVRVPRSDVLEYRIVVNRGVAHYRLRARSRRMALTVSQFFLSSFLLSSPPSSLLLLLLLPPPPSFLLPLLLLLLTSSPPLLPSSFEADPDFVSWFADLKRTGQSKWPDQKKR